jgi:hypothetical protein
MYQAVIAGPPRSGPRSILGRADAPAVQVGARDADGMSVLRLIHERLAELARRGYRHHPVTGAVLADHRAARRLSCPECNHRGMHFAALAHPDRPGHIALAWCDVCRVAVDVSPPTGAPARSAR